MGHVDPSSTAVYLTITPALLDEANRRFERFAEPAWTRTRERAMSPQTPLGQLLHSFFLDHLITVKGLRPASVRSYRDTIRLLIVFTRRGQALQDHQADGRRSHVRADRRASCVTSKQDRGNHIRTRNQRLAAIHTLFEYIATRAPRRC